MLNLFEVIIILSVLAAVLFINYLIFACSKISPCYIEFDDRKKSEMRLMRSYNEGFKKIFLMYVTASVFIALLVLVSFSIFVAFVLMGVQIVYIAGASSVMLWMYVRSRLYWSLEEKSGFGKPLMSLLKQTIYGSHYPTASRTFL